MPKHDREPPIGHKRKLIELEARLVRAKAVIARDRAQLEDRLARAKAEVRRLEAELKARFNRKPRPPEGGEPIPAIPPRGPVPLAGGAEAPIE